MRKTASVLLLATIAILAAAGPAVAQEKGAMIDNPTDGKPPSPPPDYSYYKGEVYVDGDLVIGCREFVEDFEGGYYRDGDQRQARRVLEKCERAGSPANPQRPPAEVRQEIRQDARQVAQQRELSKTGGAPALSFAAGLLTVLGAGLVAFVYRIS